MIRFRFWFLIVLCCLNSESVWAFSKDGRDTLKTRAGDRLIVPYEYTISENQLTIKFKPAIKRLGNEKSRRYRKPEELTVVIFDRKGSFEDAVFTGDIIPEAFVVPSNLSYCMTHEGYYLLHDSPSLTFTFRDNVNVADLTIPAYLAYHVKKGRYKLIERCSSIKIKVSKPDAIKSTRKEPVNETIVSTVEIESDNGDMTRILDCIANINGRLQTEDRLPMSESLEDDVRLLREWKYNVTDPRLKEKVNETLDAYEQKKRQLENDAEAASIAEQKKAEEELKAQNEAALMQQREDAEKNRKRNIWLMIGGVIAAAGLFLGNQLMQNHNNRKSQKDIMEMQQSLANKAKNEAKRSLQSKARSQTTHSLNKVRSKTKETIKKNVRI